MMHQYVSSGGSNTMFDFFVITICEVSVLGFWFGQDISLALPVWLVTTLENYIWYINMYLYIFVS